MDKKNDCLNMIKGIACFFVIFIHIPFPGWFGIVLVTNIARFAVPVFFMISGFFLWRPEDDDVNKRLLRKIKRLFKVCLVVIVVLFFWKLLDSNFGDGHLEISAFVRRCFTIKNLIKFIIFQNTSIFGGRSAYWFLFALLFTYIILLVVFRLPKWRFIYISIPILLITSFYLWTTDIAWHYYSNLWFTAIPFVLLGYLIAEGNLYKKISPLSMVIISMISLLVVIYGSIVHITCPISITQFAISIFSICIFCLSLVYSDVSIKTLSNIGAKYSMLIYIFHPIVISVVNNIAKMMKINDRMFFSWCAPILVALISLFLSVAYVRIKSLFIHKN